MNALCRDCLSEVPAEATPPRCPACQSRRILAHPELHSLSIAHIDCDAFYASVEKRDDPSLRDKPVVIGGGKRGVVSAACYVARTYGIRSAMPMFKALQACPQAVVIRPNMAKYREAGLKIREMMLAATPLVEPLSIDEAFLDLSGTEALHHGSPAVILAGLAKRIEEEHGLTVSIGLSYNKFLAKIASDLDKPRGFAVIGEADAMAFLKDKPVGMIWGVGKALRAALARDGVQRIGDLLRFEELELIARYGAMGRRLYRFARGEDDRRVDPDAPTKSISAETTFERDIGDPQTLLAEVWPLCETVARRTKKSGLAGQSVSLKLKTAGFQTLTRSRRLQDPTRLAETIYGAVKPLIEKEADGRKFRLIGAGLADLVDGALADPPSLFDPERTKHARIEGVIDTLRERLGPEAIRKGRSLK
ncbi:MAG: DNA polymerase IV [Rhodovibrionaceae bacterium]